MMNEDFFYMLGLDVDSEAASAETFVAPSSVQKAAKRALGWMADGEAGKGFTDVGRKRASMLAHGQPVSLVTVRRMFSYFSRHVHDRDAVGFRLGEDGFPSPGRVAWDAWGGDPGFSWVKGILRSK